MRFPRRAARFLPALALFALSQSGCIQAGYSERIEFPGASVNGRPARQVMDTGAETTVLLEHMARRAGVSSTRLTSIAINRGGTISLSEPAQLVLNARTERARLPVSAAHIPWFVRGQADLDVLVGWPQFRGNILQFDPVARIVRRLEAVPPETQGWLRLKVLSHDTLHFELPQADGKPIEIFVDTGDTSGIGVPKAIWTEWEATHPGVKTTLHYGSGIGPGSFMWREAEADSITLGPLTLTDVALYEWGRSDIIFGLEAVARMHLIIDGPAGFAYLKPIAEPRPPRPANEPASARNWTVDPSVRLDFSRVHGFAAFLDAALKAEREDFPGAIAGYTQAFERDPRFHDAISERGVVRRRAGDLPAAIADFEQAMALDPTEAEHVYRRGFTRQMQGDDATALVDYNRYLELAPNEWPRAYLIRHILEQRLGRPVSEYSTKDWPPHHLRLAQFLAGSLPEADLLQAAERTRGEVGKTERCDAYYFVAVRRHAAGDTAAATEFLRRILAVDPDLHREPSLLAAAQLARLNGL